MNKKILLQQANGFTNGVHTPKKKTKLEKLKDMQKEVTNLIAEEEGKKRKPKKEETKPAQQASFIEKVVTTVNNAMLKQLQQDKQHFVEKSKNLERNKKQLEEEVALKNEEINKLNHLIADQQKTIKRTFHSSNILQLVEPTIEKKGNPIKNILTYVKKKKEYNTLVKTTNTKEFRFVDSQEGLQTTFTADNVQYLIY